jgi:hypothetical protein
LKARRQEFAYGNDREHGTPLGAAPPSRDTAVLGIEVDAIGGEPVAPGGQHDDARWCVAVSALPTGAQLAQELISTSPRWTNGPHAADGTLLGPGR